MFKINSKNFPISKMFSCKVPPYKFELVYLNPDILRNLNIKVRIPKFKQFYIN